MYKELRETKIKTMTQISQEYPGLAYLVSGLVEPRRGSISLEPRGTLFAVADKEGLSELLSAQEVLNGMGLCTMVDTNPLSSDNFLLLG